MKLKQKFALSLCIFYAVSVIGVALSMHFCGGRLASVTYFSNKTACKFCKAEAIDKKDDGCCKNTKIEVKVRASHQIASSFKLPQLPSFELLFHPQQAQQVRIFVALFSTKLPDKAPPLGTRVAIHAFNCVFRN